MSCANFISRNPPNSFTKFSEFSSFQYSVSEMMEFKTWMQVTFMIKWPFFPQSKELLRLLTHKWAIQSKVRLIDVICEYVKRQFWLRKLKCSSWEINNSIYVPINIHLIKFPFNHFSVLIQSTTWYLAVLLSVLSGNQVCHVFVEFWPVGLNARLLFPTPSLFMFTASIPPAFFVFAAFGPAVLNGGFWHWFSVIIHAPAKIDKLQSIKMALWKCPMPIHTNTPCHSGIGLLRSCHLLRGIRAQIPDFPSLCYFSRQSFVALCNFGCLIGEKK